MMTVIRDMQGQLGTIDNCINLRQLGEFQVKLR